MSENTAKAIESMAVATLGCVALILLWGPRITIYTRK